MMDNNDGKISGKVLDIQRMSTEDGPGLRTTVFLKGCTLRCAWCHNPESIDPRPEIQWSATACIGCRTCVDICKASALFLDEAGLHIDRKLCTRCGICTEECPSMAIVTSGIEWTVDELVAELLKDRAFFENSEGGVTLSGGELAMQADFCREVLKQLEKHHIHTAIDTCGQCSKLALEKMLPYAGMVLFDLKEMDSERHKLFTGHSNEMILENVKFVAVWLSGHNRSMWIRTPVIPGATMDENNIKSMGKFISENLERAVTRWELCTFNNLCKDKYSALGLSWKYANTRLVVKEEIERLADIAKDSGVNPDLVHWSGLTRQADENGEEL